MSFIDCIIYENAATEENEAVAFTIDDDMTADWAIDKIKEATAEHDRLVGLATEKIAALKAQIEQLDEKLSNDTSFLTNELRKYAATKDLKSTKTQAAYKLLSGSLVFKKASVKITHDDDALCEFLSESGYSELVKVKTTPNWAEVKKLLEIKGDRVVVAETGEIVEACGVEEVPETFSVKF